MSFSKLQYFTILIFKGKTKDLERKHAVHFPRRTRMNEKRKPKYRYPNEQPNPILSMKVKTKNKPKELLNVNENCPFGPTSTRETSQT
jgi:hypothetical protein